MEKEKNNFGLQILSEHKHSPQYASTQHDTHQEYISANNQYCTDLVPVSIPEIDLPQDQRGVDNRLRAIFGKVVPQLAAFLYDDPPTCFSYLKDACAAEDANDRAAYLHVISQIWDRIQSHRQKCQKRTKLGNSNRIAKRVKKLKPIVEEVDEEAPAVAEQQSTFETSNILNERDLLWIVKYAEFGTLATQLTKAACEDTCLVILSCAKSMDELKSEFHYDLAIRNMQRILERHKSRTILNENATQEKCL